MNNCDKYLQTVANRDILASYLMKGGIYDCNGRIHYTGGGSTESASTCRYRQAAVAPWGDARIQDRQSVAHQTNRTRTVATGAQEQKSRNQVMLVISPATPRQTPVTFQAPSGCPMVTLPVEQLSTRKQARQVAPCAFL